MTIMYNNFNEHKSGYAYVTLVMIDPKYVIGAITLAQSLKKTNTKHDIICMVTPDITGTPFNILLDHFTYVITVNYVQIKTKLFKSEKRNNIYGNWIDNSYTKFSAMLLDKYEKVCLLDSDMIVTNNIDHLFSLPAPVGVFSNHWFDKVIPKKYSKKSCNYYMNIHPVDKNFKITNAITPELMYKALTQNGFVASGNIMVLESNKSEFEEMISIIKKIQPFGLNCSSGGDEQSICYYQSLIKKRNWTCLKHAYNVIPWKLNETLLPGQKPYVLHYNMTPKPWNNIRYNWLDNAIWWAVAKSIPNIKKICFKLCIPYINFKYTYCPYCNILSKKLNHDIFKCPELFN